MKNNRKSLPVYPRRYMDENERGNYAQKMAGKRIEWDKFYTHLRHYDWNKKVDIRKRWSTQPSLPKRNVPPRTYYDRNKKPNPMHTRWNHPNQYGKRGYVSKSHSPFLKKKSELVFGPKGNYWKHWELDKSTGKKYNKRKEMYTGK